MKNKTRTIGKIFSALTLTNMVVAMFALIVAVQTPVFAQDTTPKDVQDLATVLDDQKTNQCITNDDRLSGWIISFIEEPLSLKEDNTSQKLQTRLCYRSTFRYIINGEETTITELANASAGCSTQAEEKMKNEALVNEYKLSYSCQVIMAVLAKGGTSFIEGYIGLIYRWAAGIAGLIAVGVIIISSVQISFAGGEAGEIDKAKGRIIKSLAGLAVLFLSGLILYTVNPTFFTK